MVRLREYLYVVWAAGVFALLPLQLMIVTLFKEYLDDKLIEESNIEKAGKGITSWPHIREQYVKLPHSEDEEKRIVTFSEDNTLEAMQQ